MLLHDIGSSFLLLNATIYVFSWWTFGLFHFGRFWLKLLLIFVYSFSGGHMSSHGKYMLNFVRGCQTVLRWLHCFAFRPAVCEHCHCSASSYLAMSVFFSFNSLFNHSNKCVVISLCGFNLHFSNALCRASSCTCGIFY